MSVIGKLYYFNTLTNETTWTKPTADELDEQSDTLEQVQVLHILKKHCQSRRPSSWRVENITQSKDEAISQIQQIRQYLLSNSKTPAELEKSFRSIARTESDCSSASKGGDLGLFGRGQMQKSFENASFALSPGQMSELVDSDSGIHIILRIK